jgi:hypothetical protein
VTGAGAPRLEGTADAAKWHLAFLLLSLERAAPFLREAGMEVEPGEALREIAREHVRAHRGVENEPELDAAARMDAYRSLLERTLQRIRTELGGAAGDVVAAWGSAFPYETRASGQAFVWRRLLRRLAGVSALGHPAAPLELPEAKRQAVIGAVRRHLGDPSGLDTRLREAERAPRSEWERFVDETYTAGATPLDWLASAIDYRNTAAAWREIAALLEPGEMAELYRWTAAQARLLEMEGVDVEPFTPDGGL